MKKSHRFGVLAMVAGMSSFVTAACTAPHSYETTLTYAGVPMSSAHVDTNIIGGSTTTTTSDPYGYCKTCRTEHSGDPRFCDMQGLCPGGMYGYTGVTGYTGFVGGPTFYGMPQAVIPTAPMPPRAMVPIEGPIVTIPGPTAPAVTATSPAPASSEYMTRKEGMILARKMYCMEARHASESMCTAPATTPTPKK